jgi:hypothetical protein
VLVTEWAEFNDLDWSDMATAMRGDVVIDGRNALDAVAVRRAGLSYEGVGRHLEPTSGGAEPALVTGDDAQPATAGSGPG